MQKTLWPRTGHHLKSHLCVLALALSLLLSGCGELAVEGQIITPTPLPSATQPPAVTAAPYASATPAPVPTRAPDVLPAPLYFISARNNQIWRIEGDGTTLTQVTREAFDIDDFDVSPVDGALTYVSLNTLYRSDARGEHRQALVSGSKVDVDDFKGRWERQIRSPRWSRNGQAIYYGQGGLNVIRASGGEAPRVLLPASAYPENTTKRISPAPVNYWPYSLSPDGAYLLALKQYFSEGISAVLVRPDGAVPPVELSTEGAGPNCCDLAWSQNSQFIYVGNHAADLYGLEFVGLWKAPVATARFAPLVRGFTGDLAQPSPAGATYTAINYAFEAEGQLYAFASVRPANEEGQRPPNPLGLARVNADDSVTLISTDKYEMGEALGAPDGSGAVLTDLAEASLSGSVPLGRLRWQRISGGLTVDLAEKGSHLRWGVAGR